MIITLVRVSVSTTLEINDYYILHDNQKIAISNDILIYYTYIYM